MGIFGTSNERRAAGSPADSRDAVDRYIDATERGGWRGFVDSVRAARSDRDPDFLQRVHERSVERGLIVEGAEPGTWGPGPSSRQSELQEPGAEQRHETVARDAGIREEVESAPSVSQGGVLDGEDPRTAGRGRDEPALSTEAARAEDERIVCEQLERAGALDMLTAVETPAPEVRAPLSAEQGAPLDDGPEPALGHEGPAPGRGTTPAVEDDDAMGISM